VVVSGSGRWCPADNFSRNQRGIEKEILKMYVSNAWKQPSAVNHKDDSEATAGVAKTSGGFKTAQELKAMSITRPRTAPRAKRRGFAVAHSDTGSVHPSQNEIGQTPVRFTVDVAGGPSALIFGRIYRKNLERAVPLLVQEIEATARPRP